MYAWEELAYAEQEGMKKGIKKGMDKGYTKGVTEKGQEIALKMLQENIPVSKVSEITGLSIEELNRLSQ